MTSKDSAKEVSSSKVANATNYLGLNLFKLLSKEKGNIFFSPFSLSAAFAMLFYGAEKETAEEIRNVLGYKTAKIQDEELKYFYQELLNEIEKSSDSYTLTTANSVVSQKKFDVRDEYKLLLNDFFKAYLWEVDFLTELDKSIQLINDWVSEKTQKMIPKLIRGLSPATVMVLLNAVYFKGFWLNPFDKNKTCLQRFSNRGEKNNYVEVEMMHIKGTFAYAVMKTYQAIELPYKGGDISMLIVLPNQINGLKDVVSSLKHDFIQDLKKNMFEMRLDVSVPKFKLDKSKSMKKAFESLGVKRVFCFKAQLGGLCESAEGLCASDVIHQAVIEVNEEGSEAAAATAIPIARCLPPEFTADHPFMFVIYNTKTNLVYFMGRVEEL